MNWEIAGVAVLALLVLVALAQSGPTNRWSRIANSGESKKRGASGSGTRKKNATGLRA